MNPELIKHLCRLQNEMYLLSFYLYNEENEIEAYQQIDEPFPLHHIYGRQLLSSRVLSGFVDYLLTPQFLLFGVLQIHDTPYKLLIGPVSLGKASKEDARNLILSLKEPGLHLTNLDELTEYLQSLPVMSFEQFMHFLCLQNGFFNQEIIQVDDLSRKNIISDTSGNAEKQLLASEHIHVINELPVDAEYGYESRLVYCIENGLIDELTKCLQSFTYSFDRLGKSALRHSQNAVIILNSMALRAAIHGGLKPDEGYKLGSVYIQQIEACTDIESLSSLTNTMMHDYCGRVRQNISIKTESAIINNALYYISTHLHEKLSTRQLAEHTGLSCEYLSSLFHRTTGKTLVTYINEQKIKKACQLLALTDLSLSEISQDLAFSSQSYFQTLFRKFSGCTPGEYRRNHRNQELFH